jgi:hypothetical protein
MRFETRTIRSLAVVAAAILLACACSKKPTLPETYPVQGKLVFPDGQPVPGGVVKFNSQRDTTVIATGEIGRDGTFTLSTFKVGVRSAGAIEGPHRVTVIFPDDFGGPARTGGAPAGGALSVVLPKPHTIQPQDNEFTLTVPKPTR